MIMIMMRIRIMGVIIRICDEDKDNDKDKEKERGKERIMIRIRIMRRPGHDGTLPGVPTLCSSGSCVVGATISGLLVHLWRGGCGRQCHSSLAHLPVGVLGV